MREQRNSIIVSHLNFAQILTWRAHSNYSKFESGKFMLNTESTKPYAAYNVTETFVENREVTTNKIGENND